MTKQAMTREDDTMTDAAAARARRKGFAAVEAISNDPNLTDLERVAVLRAVNEALHLEAMPAAVEAALDHGATWSAVGDALGVTKQAAQQQWSRRLTARRLPRE